MTGFAVTTSFQVRLVAYEPFHDAISETKESDKATLASVEIDGVDRIGVLNNEGRAIGLIAADDYLNVRLRAGEPYAATVIKIVRGGGALRFRAVFIEVRMAAGTLQMPRV